MRTLLRATTLGLATGSRSTVGLAALAVSAAARRPTASRGSVLSSPWTAAVTGLALAGELAIDQLPATPSRLEPGGLIARLVLGGVAGATLSHRAGDRRARTLAAAGLGVAAAGAGAYAGAGWRRWAGRRLGGDRPGALIEDGLALGAAAVATRA